LPLSTLFPYTTLFRSGWAFTLPAIVALIVKLIRPEKPLLISGRAVVFLLSTILMTAIILPDVVVKHHWGRPRPITTSQFNGTQRSEEHTSELQSQSNL